MGQFEIEVFIARPVEQVFDYLADVNSTPEWYSAVKSARSIEGGWPRLGAHYEITRDLPQGRVSDVVEITKFERPHRFEFGAADGATPFSYDYHLSERDGGTVLKLNGDITLSGAAKLLSPVATQAFKRGMKDNLNALKAVVESR